MKALARAQRDVELPDNHASPFAIFTSISVLEVPLADVKALPVRIGIKGSLTKTNTS